MANKKFVISGLDNAGKTSLLVALSKKYNFIEEVKQLQPTVRVAYSRTDFLGNTVNFWDMGGQVKFRNQYLKKVDYYFSDVDVLYYVIDIQDFDRFDDSLAYFTSIFNYLTHVNHFVPVVVCFHKFDPEIQTNEDIRCAVDEWQELITERFPDWFFLFAETSIYDIRSIVGAMSVGFNLFVQNFEGMIALYEAFRQRIDGYAVLLYTLGGIIISEAYSEGMTPEMQEAIFTRVRDDLKDIPDQNDESYIDMGSFDSFLHKVAIVGNEFYIGVFYPPESADKFDEFCSEFREKTVQMLEFMK
ncbi:MAG TPA: ADP-ribosylation factor-like protein [Candidatus Lokiarchaeia archaeon]|nr:ADP-ribosylation factor-like protein [Candidatus Lokiarchaeia archaeon]